MLAGALRPHLLLIGATITVVPSGLGPGGIHAQSAAEIVPVTDAMLQDPPAEDMWRRTLDRWGTARSTRSIRTTSVNYGWSGRAA
jgi:hypothetical protein